MTGIIYTRVSTKEQVEEGNSLETQLRLCKQFANKNEVTVIKDGIFREEGESAKSVNRKVLKSMMEFCVLHKGKIQCLIIYRIDRLSRDAGDYNQLKNFFNGLGIKVISVSEKIEDNPTGHFVETILAGAAQLENEIRGERSKNGMIDAVREGRYPWKAPYGYINTRVNGKKNIAPEQNDELLKLLREGWTLIDCGFGETEALKTLRKKGLNGPNGKPMRIQTFSKMLRNPIYKGLINKFDLSVVSQDIVPIVEQDLWDRVYEKLEGKQKRPPKYKKLNPDYPLRGDLICIRGHRMTGSASRGNGGLYARYHCPKCRGGGTSFDNVELNNLFIDFLNLYEYPSGLNEALKEAFILNLESDLKINNKHRRSLEKQISELDALDLSITKKNVAGIYSDNHTSKMLSANDLERTQLQFQLNDLDTGLDDAEEIIQFGFNTMSTLGETWKETDNMFVKQKFQKWVFPSGFSYDGQKFGTSKTALCLSVKKDFSNEKSLVVIPRRIELLLPG